MFREMRRKNQLLSESDAAAILRAGTHGVLAAAGDDGYPYAVPMSYVYTADGRLFFHWARSGHKLDAVLREPKASFCVVGQDVIVPEHYTTHFSSVIAFGRVRVLTDDAERLAALLALAEKYTPGDPAGCRKEAEGALSRVCIAELVIEHLTGKEAIELTRARTAGAAAKE